MKDVDKLLVAILGGIGALIIVGLAALFLLGGRSETVLPEDTPEGVVQRFVSALDKRDAETAYKYLSEGSKARWSYAEFQSAVIAGPQRFPPRSLGETSSRTILSKSTVRGDTAEVIVTISTVAGGGPFSYSEYTREEAIVLKREGGQWKIESFPEYEFLRPKEFRPPAPAVAVTPIPVTVTPTVTPTPTPQPAKR